MSPCLTWKISSPKCLQFCFPVCPELSHCEHLGTQVIPSTVRIQEQGSVLLKSASEPDLEGVFRPGLTYTHRLLPKCGGAAIFLFCNSLLAKARTQQISLFCLGISNLWFSLYRRVPSSPCCKGTLHTFTGPILCRRELKIHETKKRNVQQLHSDSTP